ncbi:MAG: hypothetical protein HC945_03705, partial [Nitrosarchaeum sp.]|nr:hypothetical protein [Nitrosarchaeum sp.]
MRGEEGRAVVHGDTAIGERPRVSGAGSFVYLVVGVGLGTVLLLLLARFRKVRLWKAWFWFAVVLTIAAALGVVMRVWLAWGVALVLASWKVFRPGPVVHNVAEILMYAGLAVLLVPIFDVFWMSVLLVVIAIYDAFAVWKSGHMVSLAKFQTASGLFAGLALPSKGRVSSPVRRGRVRASASASVPGQGRSAASHAIWACG